MKKVYKGSNGGQAVFVSLFFIIVFGILLRIAFWVPSPLNYGFFVILGLGAIIFIAALFQMTTGFYLEINEDGSMRIVRGGHVAALPLNTFKSVGGSTINLSILKDNIENVSIANDDDIQLISKWSPQQALVTVNPIKRAQYGLHMLKNATATEYDEQKGFGPYSVLFVTNTKNLVKLNLKHLTIQNCLSTGSVVKEYAVENPIIFVPLKEYKEFVSSYKR